MPPLRLHTFFATASISLLISTGCISDQAAKELGEQFAAPFAAFASFQDQIATATDLGYATAAYRRRHERWPRDYAELKTLVEGSDGLLMLRDYDHVEFTEFPDGRLDVLAIIENRTNRLSFAPGRTLPTE